MTRTMKQSGHLIPQLAQLGRKRRYSPEMMQGLSGLPPINQTNVAQAVLIEGAQLTEREVHLLRSACRKGAIPIDDVMAICCGDQ